ncbi:S-adenosylmethionine-dependent methyltransferase [Methylophaga frappieri]|uniref:tRNA 5-carboxymethoxyuridine methyltransferase n=1 Tax=Methylophaga frappieri (strain ATCC BAA-2434 / DSM 25690 / JAM7) TaxID=754477 RepID=I1YH52_METFJ|nr:methyltransferase domain-containing protein [Methylophaga frappieri]AFJ02245.1 S-adenosylmethionine-dependent methyltransferase [Methylophaga frappieri]
MQDRNFDDLAARFRDRIYDTEKGRWRLTLLKEDLAELAKNDPLQIWDAGCGLAQISLWLAKQGHHLTLCDISATLLDEAKSRFHQANCDGQFHQQPAQSLANALPEFDMVINHAVLEWLADPVAGLEVIAKKVRPEGYLSLMFYNRNAMVYQNVLRGGWRLQSIIDDRYIGKGNRLSPPHPLYPHEVQAKLQAQGFEIIKHTGIRVFSDYLSAESKANSQPAELQQLEAQYCRMPAYRDLGRYVHFLAKKTASPA